MLAPERADAFEAVSRPERIHVVVDLERGHTFGERHPGQFRPGEDVAVRRKAPGPVERPRPDEGHAGPAIPAVEGCRPTPPAEDSLRGPASARPLAGLRLAWHG